MFRRVSTICQVALKPRAVSFSTNRCLAEKLADKWDLYAGIVVERLPILSKSLTPLEEEFQKYLWQIEFENSLKSNHELQHERDLQQAELIKKAQGVDLDETASKQTAQDLKDAYTEEAKKFQLPSRTNEKESKITSTNRQLEDVLYLLVEHKLGKKKHFLLPQGPRLDGESMRQAAERVLKEKCGDSLHVMFYGNAPCGFYKYKYPSEMRGNSVGAKVFFYRATLKAGNVDQHVTKNFEWLVKSALSRKIQNSVYTENVKRFLL